MSFGSMLADTALVAGHVLKSLLHARQTSVVDLDPDPFSGSVAMVEPRDRDAWRGGVYDGGVNHIRVKPKRRAKQKQRAEFPDSPSEAAAGTKLRWHTRRQVTVSSHFKMVFWTITAITVLSFVASIAMAMAWGQPNANQQSVFEGAGWAWKVGFGALVGLLGGKSL
jgi:hypothetical protein